MRLTGSRRFTAALAAVALTALAVGGAWRTARAEEGAGAKPAPALAPTEAELLRDWREDASLRTARRRVFTSLDGATRRGLVSPSPRWDPVTGAPVSTDLALEGALLASDQGDLRIEAPLVSAKAPARMVMADGSVVEVSLRSRFVLRAKGAPEGDLSLAAREVGASRPAPGRARYEGAFDGGDLVLESAPGALETSLSLTSRPRGLDAYARGAAFFEEEILLPSGWSVEGLDAAEIAGAVPGIEAGGVEDGFHRIDQRLHVVDGMGDLRLVIEAPRVFESGREKGAPGRDADAFAEVRFDARSRVLVYRTAAPAAWLADPARAFPVVFDPALTANTPVVIPANTSSTNAISLTPRSAFWNAVGVSSPEDFDLSMSPANSNEFNATCDFCVADANGGNTISVVSGNVSAFFSSGAQPATVEHATPGSVRLDINTGSPWAATSVLGIFEVNVPTASSRALVVEGVTGLQWAVFAPRTSSTGAWATRAAMAAGPFAVGSTQRTINFSSSGYWMIAVWKDGGPGASGTVSFKWPNTPNLSLARDIVQTAASSPVNFTIASPRAGFWNAVGVFESDWDVVAPASSSLAGSTTDFILADGNKGTITPVTGGITRFSGATTALVEHSTPPDTTTSIIPGTSTSRAWATTDVLRVFEVFVGTPGPFTMNVNGVTNVRCALFAPQANAAWISRGAATATFAAGSATSVSFTATGFWAIAVFRDSASAPVGATLNFDWTGSTPAPVLTSIAPSSVTAGAAAFTLTARGSAFTNLSRVRVNGVDRATTFVSATTLTAQILAADVVTASAKAITVFTPGPGGGVSAAQTLTVQAPPPHPLPVLAAIAPSSAVVGSATFTLTVNGSGFVPASVVHWNGAARATTFVGAATLTAQILATDVVATGTAQVTVVTPTPGGGTSAARAFTVNSVPNPAPTLTSISPDTVLEGAPSFLLFATGTDFVAGAVVRWNGIDRPTTFVSATRLEATIPDTDVAFAGAATVTVFNPAPGGGVSLTRVFTILGGGIVVAPTITSISPSTVTGGAATFRMTITGTDFGPGAVARMDGVDLATTVLSLTTIEATITAADVATAGTHAITVFDQVTGLASGSATFTVTPGPGGGTGGSTGGGTGAIITGKNGASGGGGGGGGCVIGAASSPAAALPYAALLAGLLALRRRRA